MTQYVHIYLHFVAGTDHFTAQNYAADEGDDEDEEMEDGDDDDDDQGAADE